MAKRVPAPSPEEIELRAREIRVKWSELETERRCVYRAKILYAPMPETYFHRGCLAPHRR